MSVDGLDDVLAAAGLQNFAPAAAKWCEEMGPRDLKEISEAEVFDEFAAALKFRPLEKRRVRLKLHAKLGVADDGGINAGSPAYPATPAVSMVPWGSPSMGQKLRVHNTFLDLDDAPRREELQRTRSEPAPEVPQEESEEDEDEGAADAADGSPGDATGTGTSAHTPDSLYRMMTLDIYEDYNQWSWAREDEADVDPGAGGASSMEAAAQEETETWNMMQVPVNQINPGMQMMPVQPGPGQPYVPSVWVPVGPFTPWPYPQPQPQLEPERKPALESQLSVASQIFRVRWTVDSKRLKCGDREHVSPQFELGSTKFRMVMKPKITDDTRGGASFKKAKGKGTVQLRIIDGLEDGEHFTVTFRLGIGNQKAKRDRFRGPVTHDFYDTPMIGLPAGHDEWDFSKAVDATTDTFVVCLEVWHA